MLVVSNTSPICYLVLIGEIDLLPKLFRAILIPTLVRDELRHPEAPEAVQQWIANPPSWLSIHSTPQIPNEQLDRLHSGERAAIVLAEHEEADLLILDEMAARMLATQRGHRITGLIGILDEAASRNYVDLPRAIERLAQTNFRASPRLLKALLDRYRS